MDPIQLAEQNQRLAETVIARCGIRNAWEEIGADVHQVGSLRMGLMMTHRDIDFHIYTPGLKVAESFRAVARIASTKGVRRVLFTNSADTPEECLEWHLFYADPDDPGPEWQIDMIQILKGSAYDGYFERIADRIKAVLTPETRRCILEIKYALPESEHVMGIEVYQAVLADGVRTLPEFLNWRKAHPAKGIVTWCP